MSDQYNAEKPFDLEGLEGLYGKETVSELLAMTVDEARGLLQQIDDGVTLKDSRVVMAAAHQLKGLAATMTIDRLAEISKELEGLARQEQWDSMLPVQKRLASDFEDVSKYVSAVLQK